ncbi:MAG: prephenate dehydrogenase [Eubacteriales bacterium]
MEKPTICVIGVGLIGGSFAKALRGFHDATIIGVDVNKQTVGAALKAGAIDQAFNHPHEALPLADIVILCVFPHHIHDIIKENSAYFKKGAVVCDVCGTKEHLYGGIHQYIPHDIDYVGVHPMAGKEVDGFLNSEGNLFEDTGFIIIPLEETKPSSIALMEEMAGYIGATRLAYSTPREHDEIVAYTSDLMHVSAISLCTHYHPMMSSAYTAGSFRDCTRIANLNPELWTELFLANREALLPAVDRFISAASNLRNAMATEDKETLLQLLTTATQNKADMMKR